MLQPFVGQLIELGGEGSRAVGACIPFLPTMNDFDVCQELDFRGQPLSTLLARPLLLVAVEYAVLESSVARAAV